MSNGVRREIIAFPTRNSPTIEEIQLSTEVNLHPVENEEEDIFRVNENIEEYVDVNSVGTESTEEDIITTYENIEEHSEISDSYDEFTEVLEISYNVRKK